MTVISTPQAFNEEDLYIDLRSIVEHSLFLKCEGFNFAGSVKFKAATEMVEAAEQDGTVRPGAILIESSSGNLGVALSMIAASKGYRFLCVTDPRCNLSSRRLMEALGAQVHTITEPDPVGGFLGARKDYVRMMCASDDRYVWLNQYNNPRAWMAHYRTTAPAIARSFPELDVLFVGAGTTGTLMGCARWFREWPRPVQIVRGFLFGGSTGTVVSGAMNWLARHDGRDVTAVTIAPDLGERYLDTVYQTNWLEDLFGKDVLDPVQAAHPFPESLPRPGRTATVAPLPRSGS
jgi:cysteine synthase A